MTIASIRDILIIFGIISSFIFLFTTTILILIIFIRVKKIIGYIEGSINEIDSLKNKIKETVPKPFASIINGALTLKKFTDSVSKRSKNKRKKAANKNSKKGKRSNNNE